MIACSALYMYFNLPTPQLNGLFSSIKTPVRTLAFVGFVTLY